MGVCVHTEKKNCEEWYALANTVIENIIENEKHNVLKTAIQKSNWVTVRTVETESICNPNEIHTVNQSVLINNPVYDILKLTPHMV
jgi:hypothetical protein